MKPRVWKLALGAWGAAATFFTADAFEVEQLVSTSLPYFGGAAFASSSSISGLVPILMLG